MHSLGVQELEVAVQVGEAGIREQEIDRKRRAFGG